MILKLSTNEEIEITDFGHSHIVLLCEDLETFRTIEDKLHSGFDAFTVEADGEIIASVSGAEITGAQTVCNSDGSITAHIYSSGGTYDLDGGEYAQAGRILLGEG